MTEERLPKTSPEVETAISSVKEGRIDDYAVVVDAYQNALMAWVSLRCPPGSDPTEVVQVVFVEAYKRIHRYQAGTSFLAWLMSFARMRLLAEYNTIERHSRNQQNYLNHLITSEIEKAPESTMAEAQGKLHTMRQCMNRLRDRWRSLLRLRYEENCSIDEMARQMGTSISVISVQLFRIRQQLRLCMEKGVELGDREDSHEPF